MSSKLYVGNLSFDTTEIDLQDTFSEAGTVSWLSRLLIRRQRGYRYVLDRVFTLHVLSWIYRLFQVRHRKAMPKFMRKTAMGVDSLFR